MLNGLDFERQVHALLKNMGFEAEITKASGDGGIDIIAHSKEHITGGKYIIQCKDWSKPVGEPPVRDLFGVVTAESANKGILITTSTFTAPAINFAAGKPLELIDGTKFNQLLSKYSLAESPGGALSTADDERIKVLTEQLNKNPKNILVIKELADIYVIEGFYDKAIALYERLGALMPSVETERLNMAYWGGINNYGVALAKQKRYDESLAIFKRLQKFDFVFLVYPAFANEAQLTLYLGLYEIAMSLFEKLKSRYENPDLIDTFSEQLEHAYLEEQPAISALIMVMDLAIIKANPGLSVIPLEADWQKAIVEGKTEVFRSFLSKYSEVCDDFVDYWHELTSKVENDLYLSQSSDEFHSDAFKNVQLTNMSCPEVVAIYESIADLFSTENSLQESYRQAIIVKIKRLKLIHNALRGFRDIISQLSDSDSMIDAKNKLLASINESTAILLEVGQLENAIQERADDEFEKEVARQNEFMEQEKAEWREKLRNTLYKDWSPK